MSLNNEIDIKPLLLQSQQDVTSESDNNHLETQQVIRSESVLVKQDFASALSQILLRFVAVIDEVNENEAILGGLSVINGAVDSTAGAVNEHTTERAQAIIDAVNNIDLSALSTTARVNAIEQAILTAIGDIDFSALATTAQLNTNSNTTNGLINSRSSTSLAGFLNAAITNSINVIGGLINSRAATSLAGYINSGLLNIRNNINTHIDIERGVIVGAINAARDLIISVVNAKGVGNIQRGNLSTTIAPGTFRDITITSVNRVKANLYFDIQSTNREHSVSFISNTTIRVTNNIAFGGGPIRMYWEVTPNV